MEMFRYLIALAPILLLSNKADAAETGSADTNRLHSPTAGFSIVKPAAWQFGSLEQAATSRAVARLKDKELEQLVRERASAPLVIILKHPEPYDNLNPSAQVFVRPLGPMQGKTPVELLRMFAANVERAMKDFTFIEDVKETTVAGSSAATMKAKYTVANAEGREFKTLSRMWLVPRGAFLFMISMSGPQEGPDVSEKDFAAILDSIKIEK